MKLRNHRDLQNHIKSKPEFQVFEKPGTTGRIKLLHYIKGEDTVIVVKGAAQ